MDPVITYTGAVDALQLTLRLDPSEVDPDVLDRRARAIATPAVISELRRFSGELLAEYARTNDELVASAESLSPDAQLRRGSMNEVVHLIATRLARRADELSDAPDSGST